MSALDNLNLRLNYRGGNQEQRMQKGKLKTLEKALLYSYQAATIILQNEDEFRALINPDKNKPDYNDMVLSIPYEEVALNDKQLKKVDIKTGDTFLWKETNTYWLIYLQYLQEDAYFRASIRRCDQEIEINNKVYKVYIQGPEETSIQWNQKNNIEQNDMNYSLVMYITKNEDTINYFRRFAITKIKEETTGQEKTWQVVAANPYYGDNIIKVYLDEYFENTIRDERDKENQSEDIVIDPAAPRIDGPKTIRPYAHPTQTLINAEKGNWYLLYNDEEELLGNDLSSITIEKIIKKQGNFSIICRLEDQELRYEVTIEAF